MNLLKTFIFFSAISLLTSAICLGQEAVSLATAVERQFNKTENDLLRTAQAMPESKFDFSPESLNIVNSDFRGVRTFAGQIMHLATDNILIWSVITGDSVRSDIKDVNGPPDIRSKKDVIEYLKSSFAIGRKALATLTSKNAMDMFAFRGSMLPRLDLVFYALTHSDEHYGQMVVYIRMLGIVPPASVN